MVWGSLWSCPPAPPPPLSVNIFQPESKGEMQNDMGHFLRPPGHTVITGKDRAGNFQPNVLILGAVFFFFSLSRRDYNVKISKAIGVMTICISGKNL